MMQTCNLEVSAIGLGCMGAAKKSAPFYGKVRNTPVILYYRRSVCMKATTTNNRPALRILPIPDSCRLS
jgi:hypothetical protein